MVCGSDELAHRVLRLPNRGAALELMSSQNAQIKGPWTCTARSDAQRGGMYRKVRCATGRHVPEGQCATGLEQGNAFEKVVRNKVVATGRVPRNMVGATGRVPPNMVIPNRKLGRNAVTQKDSAAHHAFDWQVPSADPYVPNLELRFGIPRIYFGASPLVASNKTTP